MVHWNLEEIIEALKKIKDLGYIQSNRLHNTGIGKTLEDNLGITENNIDLPDFGTMELKSQRSEAGSMITLFTKKPEGTTNKEILEKYGYPDKKHPNVKSLHQTIGQTPNGRGFHYDVSYKENKLKILQNQQEIGYYSLDFIESKALEKFGDGIILVFAKTKKDKETKEESFFYHEAYLLKGFKFESFLKHLLYDIRMGTYKSGKNIGKPHDHGSGFRIKKSSINDIFETYQQIL